MVTKLLEIIILHRCPILTESHNSQYGFKNESSTLHAEFIVNETIRYYNQRGSPVYICSLNAEKAFDSCNWNSLFSKLSDDKHLPTPVINILHKLYENGTANVSYLDQTSHKFNLTQGVRQGSILSPYLYNIYTEELLSNINAMNVGTMIGNEHTAITAYADDLILMSATLSGLQKLINECVDYGKNNFIKFNAAKTVFVVSGMKSVNNSIIYVDNNAIQPTSSLVHLGFHWKIKNNQKLADLQSTHTVYRLQEAWAATNALISSGIRFSHPDTIKILYNTQIIPKLTYGLELCDLSINYVSSLKRHARSMLKCLFNVSKFSKNILLEALRPISM